MEENEVQFRHLMLFFYRKSKNVTQAANEICAVYGEGAVTDRTDFNLKDQERPGRPSTTDEDQIKTLIENNPRYTIRKLADHHSRAFCEAWLHKPFSCIGSPRVIDNFVNCKQLYYNCIIVLYYLS